MTVLRRLWNDDAGFVLSFDLLLISTIAVLAMVVGLSTYRDSVIQELGDLATAVGALNQSYSFAGATVGGFTVAGSSYTDNSDFCDAADVAGQPPACIQFVVANIET